MVVNFHRRFWRLLPARNAANFHLSGLARPDVEYILTTFQAIANEDAAYEAKAGQGKTRRQIH